MLPVLPTSLIGSYAQPDWHIDRAKLAGRFPPRVRAKELWRAEPALLAQAQDDATQLAIRAQERAGLDLLTHTEQISAVTMLLSHLERQVGADLPRPARSAARATRTTSRRRWTASTSTTRAPRSTAPGIRTGAAHRRPDPPAPARTPPARTASLR